MSNHEKRALVLGARRPNQDRKGNIGSAVAATLQSWEWKVDAEDCLVDPETDFYDVPNLALTYADKRALIITLGATLTKPFHETWDEEMLNVLRACLVLPLRAANLYLQHREGPGTIVFVGSYAHDHPITNGTIYGAAKAGLNQAAKNLAWDYAPRFSVHIVHPYHVTDTPLWDEVQDGVMHERGWTREEAEDYARQNLRQHAQLSRWDVANVILQLCQGQWSHRWLSGNPINMYGGTR